MLMDQQGAVWLQEGSQVEGIKTEITDKKPSIFFLKYKYIPCFWDTRVLKKKWFVVYLTFPFSWAHCISSDNPRLEGGGEGHG